MRIEELFEADEKFDSSVVINALSDTNELDEREAEIVTAVASRINQSHPDGITIKDIKNILREPEMLELSKAPEKDPDDVDAEELNDIDPKEVLNFIFSVTEIDIKL